MTRAVGTWPTLSGPHKDGGRHVGVRVLPDAREQLVTQGRVVANKMVQRSVDLGLVASVRVGDVLDVRFDGDRGWWVWDDENRLGRLTWSPSNFNDKEWRTRQPRIDVGQLQVIRLVLDAVGTVINAGGIVYPAGETIPTVRNAVPTAEVYIPTLRATVANGNVSSSRENLPGAPRVGRPARNLEPVRKRRLWEWLQRR